MKQLSGLDASFLYMETDTTYGHVNGLGIYERPSPDFDAYTAVRERFGSMVGHVEPFRRRIVEVPFGLDHPYWVDDPAFDLDFHVRQIALARPGHDHQLADQVARIVGRKMDRSHPLWEVYVIEGLEGDRWALLTKFHHATIDGAAGVTMLQMLTSLTPEAAWPYQPLEWSAPPLPSDTEVLRQTLSRIAGNPAKAARLQLRLVRNLARAAGLTNLGDLADRSRQLIAAAAGRGEQAEALTAQLRRVSMPITPAPATPWNRSVGPHRRLALRSASLDDIKRIKDATGGTVNDVVMAICAGASASTCSATTRSRPRRCGRWCRCRSAPVTRTIRGPTACRRSSPSSPPTATTRSSGCAVAAPRCSTPASSSTSSPPTP